MSVQQRLLFNLFLVASAAAQNSRIFGWKFGGNFFSNSLATCEQRTIIVQPFASDSPADALGVPPYFMLAMPTGSTPRLYPLGSNPSQLEWTVDFPPSTELLLTVIDSNNTSGGVPANLFTVVAGQNSNCVKQVDTNSGFTISANVTSTIETCKPWGLTVKGGVPPYRWTLAQVKSPVVTNVTGSSGEDALVYIMRGDVGQKLFVTASDSTGQFAYGTPVITPEGSTDVDCPGLNSRTGNSTEFLNQKQEADKASADSARRKNIIIGVVVAAVVVVLAGIILAFVYIRRRRQAQAPRPFIASNEESADGQNLLRVDPYHPLPSASTSGQAPSPYGISPDGVSNGPSFTTFPASAAARRKRMMASEQTPTTSDASVSSTSQVMPGPSMQQAQNGEEIIIQHRDGGGIIRELPPPYMDRTTTGPSDPSSITAEPTTDMPAKRS